MRSRTNLCKGISGNECSIILYLFSDVKQSLPLVSFIFCEMIYDVLLPLLHLQIFHAIMELAAEMLQI